MKRLFIAVFIGVVLIGCKAKKSTAISKNSKQETTRIDKNNTSKRYDTKGLYPLPEDTGKFKRFTISSVA